MAEFVPTKEQQQAIDARGSAVLVSAAAGSGKTRVLTQRLMGYLTGPDPKSIDSFLIITFTRAAAGELRSRIMEELSRAMARRPDDPALRRQYALLGRAQIGTIHGFCTNLIREHCMTLGLSPDVQVADDSRAAAMKQSALTRTLEAAYEHIGDDENFRLLVDTVGAGRDDARLEALVRKLYEKMQCHPVPARWAEEQRTALYAGGVTDAADTVWGRYLLDELARDALAWAGAMDALLDLMATPEYAYIGEKYAPSIAGTAGGLRAFADAAGQGWDRAAALADIPFPRLGTLRKPEHPDVVEHIKTWRDACKKACGKWKTAFAAGSEAILADLRKTAPAMDALLTLTMAFDKRYAADKRRKNLVDYADLEHFAAKLLAQEDGTPTPLARELSNRYTEIMVDEYQDVSRVQELIFRCVSKDGANLFTVGDVKQSIYRFRLADPGIFTEKYLAYADYAAAEETTPRRILLQQNFRSRKEVLDGTNAVFENIMSRTLGELDYDENARLNPGAGDGAGKVPKPTLYLVEAPRAGENEEAPDAHAVEAAFVAEKIREIVDGGLPVTDGPVRRPARYGDIALLIRSANAVSPVYRRALADRGIPVQSEQGGGYYDSPEISLMRSMLAIIDNPRQDVPLIAVLRSPYLGFSPDDLALIRAAGKQLSFYGALCLRAGEDEKSRQFLDTLNALRRVAPDLPLSELLLRIYNDFSILAVSAAMEDGPARRRNLMALIDLATQFESTGFQGLRRFVTWLDKQAQSGQEPASAAPDSGGGVSIMSIHRSKGLEFPIVFVCDLDRRFNQSDAMETVLVHPVLGLGPKVTDTRRGIEYHTMARRAIARRLERETLSEEMRLLYVAMTRAKEYLYMTASMKDPQKAVADLTPLVSAPMLPQVLANAGKPVQWLISAVLADGFEHLSMEYAAPPDAEETAARAADTVTQADETLVERIRENLGFAYPHVSAQDIPSKVTATELKHIGDERDGDAADLTGTPRRFRPFSPDAAAKLTAAQRGTATHLVFQHIDLAKTESLEQVQGEISRLEARGFLTHDQAASVDASQVFGFFTSPEGQVLQNADKVLREFKFSLLRPAEDYFPGAGDDAVLLQGVIDCAAEADGAWTIIDYKTDAVTADTVQERAAFYRSQVQSYAQALTAITGKPVAKTVLYFLRPGISITF